MKTFALRSVFSLIAASIFSFDDQPANETPPTSPSLDFRYEFNWNCASTLPTVVFLNGSTEAKSLLWDFGDGTTSDVENPSKMYEAIGEYDVIFWAMIGNESMRVNKQLQIVEDGAGGKGPKVEITYSKDGDGRTVNFHVTTLALTYVIYFGDGTSSTADQSADVPHTYAGSQRRTATVFTQDDNGVNCSSVEVVL